MRRAAAKTDAPEVLVSVSCPGWSRALPGAADLCRAAAAAAVGAVPGAASGAEVSVLLADDAAVQALNRKYRGRDQATNVLAFASVDGAPSAARPPAGAPVMLGDVIVAFETVRAEANEAGKDLAGHLSHMVVHGTLHLLGFGHEANGEAAAMEKLESRILLELGVADPYQAGQRDA